MPSMIAFTKRFRLPFWAVTSSVALFLLSARETQAAVDFSRDILPILSDKCFHCHGPDAKTRKANLRFDTKEGAFRLRKGKSVIVPGNSAASELVRRPAPTKKNVCRRRSRTAL